MELSQKQYIKPPVNKADFYLNYRTTLDYKVFNIIDPRFHKDGYIDESDYETRDFLYKLPPALEYLYFYDFLMGVHHEGGFAEMYSYDYIFPLYRCLGWLYEAGEFEVLAVFCMAIEYFELERGKEPECIAFRQLASQEEKINYIKNLPNHFVDFQLPTNVSYDSIHATSLAELDKLFESQKDRIFSELTNHIRENPSRYVVDENGMAIDDNFTGVYENHAIEKAYTLPMLNGKPHGKFRLFNGLDPNSVVEITGEFEHGELKYDKSISQSSFEKNGVFPVTCYEHFFEKDKNGRKIYTSTTTYDNSSQLEEQTRKYAGTSHKVGKQYKWYENGNIKEIEDYYDENNPKIRTCEKYYENGQLESKFHDKDDDSFTQEQYYENGQKKREAEYFSEKNQKLEKSKWWYEDGTLAGYTAYDDDGNYIEHCGFYHDGSKAIEYTYDERGELIPFNAWDRQGNQTLKDGIGVVDYRGIHDYRYMSTKNCIEEYRTKVDFTRTEFYDTGEVSSVTDFENGKYNKSKFYNRDGSER